jgi:Undecaprenyl-phosphate glucose phosphotransferase
MTPTSKQSMVRRQGDARRESERLKAGVALPPDAGVGVAPPPMPAPKLPTPDGVDRRRQRKKLADVFVPRRQHNLPAIRLSLRTFDAVVVSILILVGVWSSYIGINNNPVLAPIAASIVGAGSFIVMMRLMGAHDFPPTEGTGDHMKRVLLACAAALGLWLTLALIIRPTTFLPDALARSGLVASGVLLVLHALYHKVMTRKHEGRALAPNIIMLGATPSARRLIEHNARTRELNILAIFDDRLRTAPHNIHGVPVVGRVEDLLSWGELPYIDRIVVTLPSAAETRKRDFVERVRLLPNRIAFVADDLESLDHVAQRVRQIADISLREVTAQPKSVWYTVTKRFMDVVVAGAALVLLSPILLLIGLLIKFDSPGPMLFKQDREGFNNRIFQVYKFRSLRVESEDKSAASQVTKGDNRVTKIGRIIRKTSLDELPQLWNVIKGDMTLVGPRPHTPGMLTAGEDSRRLVAEYAHRHKVKPGMTGWAQINGSRGPMHKADDVTKRVTMDVAYIENATIWWDIVIMAKTIPCLLGDSEVDR